MLITKPDWFLSMYVLKHILSNLMTLAKMVDEILWGITVLGHQKLFNPLVPGICGINFKSMIFKLTPWIWFLSISYWIALRRMLFDPTGDESTLVQVMNQCRQVTSHYLSHCWHRPISPYNITRPQWVKHAWFAHDFTLASGHLKSLTIWPFF